jgi:arylsulfatase A-like enzyme
MARVLSLLIALAVAGGAAGRPPNVVLLFCDDLGYADVGCFGATTIRTPNIDALARAGCRMTDFYVAQAVCSASRAALMTGCYPNRVGILGALSPEARIGIAERETTLAETLRAKGYATAIYGKWHLGHHEQFLPPRHGFDEYHGLPYSNDMWPNHAERKRNYPPLPLIDGLTVAERMPDQRLLTEWATARAEAFIGRNRGRPFFLYMPYSMPHVPLHVSEPRAGRRLRDRP